MKFIIFAISLLLISFNSSAEVTEEMKRGLVMLELLLKEIMILKEHI